MILDLFQFKRDIIEKAAGFFITISSIAGFFHFPNLYYFVLFLIGIKMIIISRGGYKVGNVFIVFFLFACLCSLFVNNPPPFFNAWNRLWVFSLMLFIVCPLIDNQQICSIRIKLLKYILGSCVLLSLGSFLAYFLGINLYVRGGELQDISAGRFSGLMSHSMFLGPVASISTIYLIYCFCDTNIRWQKIAYCIAALCCFFSALLSASRIAILSVLVGLLFYVIRFYRKRLTKAFMVLSISFAIAFASFPLWEGFADFLVEKQLGNIEMGGVFYSREKKTHARIEEFKSSPIFGIGFNTVDPSLDVVNKENGQIEPGSSWLEVLSMTGIFGSIFFLIVVGQFFKRAWRLSNSLSSSLLVALFAFFFTHMLAEGWALSARAFLSFLFWLTAGTTYAYDNWPLSNSQISLR